MTESDKKPKYMSAWTVGLIKVVEENFRSLEFIRKTHSDGSRIIYLNTNKRSIWISTHSEEYTIGEDNSDGNCVYHFHLGSKYGYEFSDQFPQLASEVSRVINSPPPVKIKSDKSHDAIPSVSSESRVVKAIENTRRKIHHFELAGNELAAETLKTELTELSSELESLKSNNRISASQRSE